MVWFPPSIGDICRLRDIEPDRFLWLGYVDRDGTGEWVLEQQMRATRTA